MAFSPIGGLQDVANHTLPPKISKEGRPKNLCPNAPICSDHIRCGLSRLVTVTLVLCVYENHILWTLRVRGSVSCWGGRIHGRGTFLTPFGHQGSMSTY